MVVNRPDGLSGEDHYRQVLGYSIIVTAIGPLLVRVAVVVPGWT